ncbi:MAG: hypothetical protein HN742_35195 [Lentisphaerae bacterium]|nr:hypothetical protein [Lentisphaerota bacterium]MBT7055204.1 hypothetical protein [Lentisphaerota bacterium]MBT7847169.1 hypothetical protein [Lentisphaerota bacterium]MBT7912927.1 hypothetical protein [Candidatus Bathyarchaeota archaeon]
MAEKIVLKAKGDGAIDYDVTFTRSDTGQLVIGCSCPAGHHGKSCKHVRELAQGDTSRLVDPSSQKGELDRAVEWFNESPLPGIWARYGHAEY